MQPFELLTRPYNNTTTGAVIIKVPNTLVDDQSCYLPLPF